MYSSCKNKSPYSEQSRSERITRNSESCVILCILRELQIKDMVKSPSSGHACLLWMQFAWLLFLYYLVQTNLALFPVNTEKNYVVHRETVLLDCLCFSQFKEFPPQSKIKPMRNTFFFPVHTSISETAWDVKDHKMHYGWEQSAFLKKYWYQMILFTLFSLLMVHEYLFPLNTVILYFPFIFPIEILKKLSLKYNKP